MAHPSHSSCLWSSSVEARSLLAQTTDPLDSKFHQWVSPTSPSFPWSLLGSDDGFPTGAVSPDFHPTSPLHCVISLMKILVPGHCSSTPYKKRFRMFSPPTDQLPPFSLSFRDLRDSSMRISKIQVQPFIMPQSLTTLGFGYCESHIHLMSLFINWWDSILLRVKLKYALYWRLPIAQPRPVASTVAENGWILSAFIAFSLFSFIILGFVKEGMGTSLCVSFPHTHWRGLCMEGICWTLNNAGSLTDI